MKDLKYISIIFLILVMAVSASGQEFKKYTIKRNDKLFLKIVSNNNIITFQYLQDPQTEISFRKEDVNIKNETIAVNGVDLIGKKGFYQNGDLVPFELISRIETEADDNDRSVTITFFRKDSLTPKDVGLKGKHRFGILEDITLDEKAFIRGSVIAFWGNVKIFDAEVGDNAIALFGDVIIGTDGVVRDNVIVIGGQTHLDKDATIYGMVNSSDSERGGNRLNWRKWYRTGQYFSPIVKFYYNRVDGAAPYVGISFLDEDSVLPEIKAYGGYAFESERDRYGFEAQYHKRYRGFGFSIKANLYSTLASDDDWLMPEWENTIFALLATEDYKDYYEATGGYAGLEIRPYRSIKFNAGFRNERIHSLKANTGLWSLFGGSKRFPSNFRSFRTLSEVDWGVFYSIDQTRLKTLFFSLEAGRKGTAYSNESFNKVYAEAEIAPASWNEERSFPNGVEYYDYTRVRAEAAHYQNLTRNTGILARGLAGTSTGDLPINRVFCLGGLTTLKGYREKEYYGTDFWTLDLNYRIKFSRFNFTGWLFYNAGEVSGAGESFGDQELKQSIGAGLTIFDFIRGDVAIRLDRSDASPVIYIRLDKWF